MSSKINQIGFLEKIMHGLSWRLPWWLFSYDHIFLMGGRDLKLKVREYPQYKIKLGTLDDVEYVTKSGVNGSLFRYRLERGDCCILVLKDDRAVAWSWSATGRLYLKLGGIIVDTGESGFFFYDVYTVPEERLKGFIMVCYEKQLEYRHERGRWDILGTISAFNIHSLKTHFRMGMKPCGEAFGFTVCGISICFYKSWPHKTRKLHIFLKRPPENLEWV